MSDHCPGSDALKHYLKVASHLNKENGESCCACEDEIHRLQGAAEILPTLIVAAALAPASSPAANHVPAIPGYEILGELGRGGMGVVYQARDLALKRLVALKVTKATLNPADRARLRDEATVVATFQHSNIVQIFDSGEQDGQPYCAFEFVEGGSLDGRGGNALVPKEAARWVELVAGAIAYAHSKNIVHRDLKPENILLTEDRVPKVCDFGVAKRLDVAPGTTLPGAIIGTLNYMAPEQAAGRQYEVGLLADVYALGAILYYLLTGCPPIPDPTLWKIQNNTPEPPSRLRPGTPQPLEIICLKCLHKDPKGRYASAAALAEDLRRFQADEPILARPDSTVARVRRWCRQRKAVAALLGIIAVTLPVATVVSVFFALQSMADAAAARQESRRANRERDEKDEETQRANRATADAMTKAREAGFAKYANSVAEADRYLLDLQPGRARENLDRCDRELRRWEWHYLRRLCSQNLALSLPSGNLGEPVKTATFDREGDRLAFALGSGRVEVWKRQEKEWKRSHSFVPEAGSAVLGLAFSPDGRRLAVAAVNLSDGRLPKGQFTLWDPEGEGPPEKIGRQDLFTPEEGADVSDSVQRVAFSPDGRYLAYASDECTIKVWDCRERDIVRVLPGNGIPVLSVAFSPDGRFLASAGGLRKADDKVGEVWLWEWKERKKVPVIERRSGTFFDVVFRPNDQLLAVAGLDKTVSFFRYTVDDKEKSFEVRSCWNSLTHRSPVRCVAFSADGKFLVTGTLSPTPRTAGYLTCFSNFEGLAAQGSLIGHERSILGVAFHPDPVEGIVASASTDGTLKLWKIPPGEYKRNLSLPKERYGSEATHKDRRAVLNADGTITVWDVWDRETEQVALTIPLHEEKPLGIAF